MATGKIKWFDTKKGFGFITPDDGDKDAFLHVSALQAANISSVKDGQAVGYELTEQRGKMAASNIKIQGTRTSLDGRGAIFLATSDPNGQLLKTNFAMPTQFAASQDVFDNTVANFAQTTLSFDDTTP